MKNVKVLMAIFFMSIALTTFAQEEFENPPPPPPPTYDADIVEWTDQGWKCYDIGWYWNGWMLWYGKHEVECVQNPAFGSTKSESSKYYASLIDLIPSLTKPRMTKQQVLSLVAKSLNVDVLEITLQDVCNACNWTIDLKGGISKETFIYKKDGKWYTQSYFYDSVIGNSTEFPYEISQSVAFSLCMLNDPPLTGLSGYDCFN